MPPMMGRAAAMTATTTRSRRSTRRLQDLALPLAPVVAEGFNEPHRKVAQWCLNLSDSRQFQGTIIGVIILAGIMVGIQTYQGIDEGLLDAVNTLDDLVLAIFIIELVVKIVAEGKYPFNFFKNAWNVFDFLIVAVGLLPFGGQAVTVLRLVRLLRVLKLVRALPKLRILVMGLLKSLSSIAYIGLLLLLLFYLYAVLGVSVFGGNDPVHMGNLHTTLLTLFRCATLEDWSDVMYIAMDGCENYGYEGIEDKCTDSKPQGILAAVYFVSFVILSSMMILNLFIGVITSSMQEAKQTLTYEAELAQKAAETVDMEHKALEMKLNDLSDLMHAISTEVYVFAKFEKQEKTLEILRKYGASSPPQKGEHGLFAGARTRRRSSVAPQPSQQPDPSDSIAGADLPADSNPTAGVGATRKVSDTSVGSSSQVKPIKRLRRPDKHHRRSRHSRGSKLGPSQPIPTFPPPGRSQRSYVEPLASKPPHELANIPPETVSLASRTPLTAPGLESLRDCPAEDESLVQPFIHAGRAGHATQPQPMNCARSFAYLSRQNSETRDSESSGHSAGMSSPRSHASSELRSLDEEGRSSHTATTSVHLASSSGSRPPSSSASVRSSSVTPSQPATGPSVLQPGHTAPEAPTLEASTPPSAVERTLSHPSPSSSESCSVTSRHSSDRSQASRLQSPRSDSVPLSGRCNDSYEPSGVHDRSSFVADSVLNSLTAENMDEVVKHLGNSQELDNQHLNFESLTATIEAAVHAAAEATEASMKDEPPEPSEALLDDLLAAMGSDGCEAPAEGKDVGSRAEATAELRGEGQVAQGVGGQVAQGVGGQAGEGVGGKAVEAMVAAGVEPGGKVEAGTSLGSGAAAEAKLEPQVGTLVEATTATAGDQEFPAGLSPLGTQIRTADGRVSDIGGSSCTGPALEDSLVSDSVGPSTLQVGSDNAAPPSPANVDCDTADLGVSSPHSPGQQVGTTSPDIPAPGTSSPPAA